MLSAFNVKKGQKFVDHLSEFFFFFVKSFRVGRHHELVNRYGIYVVSQMTTDMFHLS